MSELIHKKHNVSSWSVRRAYRNIVIASDVDEKLKEICGETSLRYEIEFLEIDTDSDHVHFLAQSVPTHSPTKIVRTVKASPPKKSFGRYRK